MVPKCLYSSLPGIHSKNQPANGKQNKASFNNTLNKVVKIINIIKFQPMSKCLFNTLFEKVQFFLGRTADRLWLNYSDVDICLCSLKNEVSLSLLGKQLTVFIANDKAQTLK